MKGLDFASVVPKGTTAAVGDDEGEDEDEDVEVSSGDDDDDEEVDGENDEDEDEDDDDDDGEDEEEDEDKDEEEEAPQVPPIKVLAAKAKQVEIVVPPTKSTKQPELKATKQAPIPVLDAQSPSGTVSFPKAAPMSFANIDRSFPAHQYGHHYSLTSHLLRHPSNPSRHSS